MKAELQDRISTAMDFVSPEHSQTRSGLPREKAPGYTFPGL
jgi:hypothetical protein